MPEIEIFRTGKWTAAQGVTLEFNEAVLGAAVSGYDPALFEAPLVVGHPKNGDRAYGWVKGLRLNGGSVFAACHQVNPDFAELVRAGAYKKVSASWYGPTNPENPKPGAYYLRHVGFLGAEAPAVKGLRTVEFAESEGEVLTFDFAASDSAVARLFRTLRDFLLAEYGQEKADRALPGWDIAWVEDLAARDAAAAEAAPAFSEQPVTEPALTVPSPGTPPDASALAVRQAELERQIADFAERQAAFRREWNAAFLDGLVAQGKALPLPKDDLLNFMEVISGDALVVDFAEAGETGGKKSALEVAKLILGKLAVTVDFAERSAGDGGEAALEPAEVARFALEFQEAQARAGITVSTTAAVAHVWKERAK